MALRALAEGGDIPEGILGVLHLKDLPLIQESQACPGRVLEAVLCPSPGAAAGDPQDPPEELLGHCGDRGDSGKAELSAHSPELSPPAFPKQRCCHILPPAPNDSFSIAVLCRLLFVAGLTSPVTESFNLALGWAGTLTFLISHFCFPISLLSPIFFLPFPYTKISYTTSQLFVLRPC